MAMGSGLPPAEHSALQKAKGPRFRTVEGLLPLLATEWVFPLLEVRASQAAPASVSAFPLVAALPRQTAMGPRFPAGA